MFFFFKLLLKTFNNFLKDKCNVSTIFCYFKTEKYMENYSTRTILEKTSPYIKISKLQLLIFQPSSCWPFLKKANIAIYQNYPEMDFVRRKVGKISYFSIPIFEYRVSYFFGNIKHRSIIGILSALLAEKLQFYSSFKWLSRVERIRIGSGGNVVRWGGNTIQIMPGTFITRPFFSEWRRRINRSSFAQYISALLSRCHARDVAPPDKGN